VRTLRGQALQPELALDQIEHTDLVLMPGFLFTLREALPGFGRYADWLRRQHAQGAVLATMCTATFLLAETGLLSGARHHALGFRGPVPQALSRCAHGRTRNAVRRQSPAHQRRRQRRRWICCCI
jgi:putative intracellular protease/amidase